LQTLLASAELITSIISYKAKIINKYLTLNQEGAKKSYFCTGLPRKHPPGMLKNLFITAVKRLIALAPGLLLAVLACQGHTLHLFYKNLLITAVKRFIAFASALSQKLIVTNIFSIGRVNHFNRII
jgi:hypothetical protein